MPAVTIGPSSAPAATVTVAVRRLDPGAPLPAYALDGDAGADVITTVDATLAPGERAVLPTGIAVALPTGYAAFVHPRSGLAARAGLSLVNAPGTVDAGYRGEIKVIVVNHDPVRPIVLRRGDRIAQLVVQRVEPVSLSRWPTCPTRRAGRAATGRRAERVCYAAIRTGRSCDGAASPGEAHRAVQDRRHPPWETRHRDEPETTAGPFDVRDAPGDDLRRVDLGALRVRSGPGSMCAWT